MEKIFDFIYENNNKNIYYFIVGDLNFRISLEREQFNLICCGDKKGIVNENQAKNEIETLKKFDQLNTVKKTYLKKKNYLKKKLIFHLLINMKKCKIYIMKKEHLLGQIEYYLKKIKILNVFFMIPLIYIFLIISL